MMGPEWYAVYCEANREDLAARMLRKWAYEVFFPHEPEWRGLGSGGYLVNRAYYPRYLFVHAPLMAFANVGTVPGVIGLVRSTDRMPFRIAQEAVDAIKSICDPLGAVHVSEAPRSQYGRLRGKLVQIAESSPFWGLVATVIAVSGLRCKVITHMLGSEREITLPVDQVAEAGPTRDLRPGGTEGAPRHRERQGSVRLSCKQTEIVTRSKLCRQ